VSSSPANPPPDQPGAAGKPKGGAAPQRRTTRGIRAGIRSRRARDRVQEAGHLFAVAFYGAYVGRRPEGGAADAGGGGAEHADHAGALVELGAALSGLGRHAEALDVDRRAAELQPDNPLVQYNLACSLALSGQPAEAVEALERAERCGYDDWEYLARDPDLRSLRRDGRFRALLRRHAGRGTADA
jgi:tetratricopeptide (TPR) repeat protein